MRRDDTCGGTLSWTSPLVPLQRGIGYRRSSAGFTLAELLITLAILSIMAAIAIPGFARLGFGARDELGRGTRDVYAMLKAAQVYATTYNVDTAVVYCPNDWETDTPTIDSITGESVRCIIGAALMYRWKSEPGIDNENLKAFVPLTQLETGFRLFAGGMTIILRDPKPPMAALSYPDCSALGMRLEPVLPDLFPGLEGSDRDDAASFRPSLLCHLFKPSGIMLPDPRETKERYAMLIGPSPKEPAEDRWVFDPSENSDTVFFNTDVPIDRLVYYETIEDRDLRRNGKNNLLSARIYLYRSTGRVQIAD